MTIQLKKAVIIFIFLLSIILILLFQNYSLKGEFYNILLISDQEDITIQTLTKTAFDSAKSLNNSQDITSYFTSVNTTYLQVQNNDDFSSKLSEQISSNDMFIVVGDDYNESLRKIADSHLDKKFVLLENSLDYDSENIYKINFDWGNIFNKIKMYLENEIKILRKNKTLDDGEKLKVVFFLDGGLTDIKPTKFKNSLSELDVQIEYVDINANDYPKKVENLYKNEQVTHFVNVNFNKQEEIIKQLVELQKDNIYSYYKQQTSEEAINEENANSDTTQENNNTQEDTENENITDEEKEIVLKPIRYLTVSNNNIAQGEYDDITKGENVVKNIIVNTFEYDLTTIFEKIIIDEEYKKETIISTDEKNLNIESII